MSSENKLPRLSADSATLYEEPNLRGTPERNLILAILERAILDYVGNNEKEAKKAENWIFDSNDDDNKNLSDENLTDDFSFEWVCQQLDLEPTRIARIIKEMPKRGNNRVAPWYFENYTVAA